LSLIDSDVVIRTTGLTKSYGSVAAVVDADMEVRRGEVFGYLGPNGAGKTTTIRVLLDHIRPTNGSATVFGMDTRANSVAIKRRVGYLPGEFSLYDSMTGEEVLTYMANLRGDVDWDYTRDLADRLDANLGRKFSQLSRGNKQKVGLIQAFMHRPELVVLDEPTGGLDPLVQQAFYDMIDEVKADGRTVFFSSHNLPEVERVCDRVAIVNHGKLVTIGAINELRAQQSSSLFEVEIEEDGAALANRLDNAPWISACRVSRRNEHSVLHAEVSELEQAKRELPRLLMESNITLIRYELMSASLEDVFMELVGGQEGER
jgi:ABC-2 type transport system ATP-binding protein